VRLFSPGFPPDDVFAHPRHESAQKTLPDLIVQLRAAANVKDGYDLQQELIGHVRETEEARNAFSKAVKRMEGGKSPQLDAPEPRSGRDPSLLETWQFERGVCERVARQFRCVGDALAWRVFGFERRHIIALCQNDPPGVWAGKAGAAAELDAVEQAYRQDGQFAILHDMTNCLRIGDMTIFRNDGSHETIEVKSSPQRSKSAQQRRIDAANDALRNGTPLRCPARIAGRGCSTWTCRSGRTWTCWPSAPSGQHGRESSQPECAATGHCWSRTFTGAMPRAGPRRSSQSSWTASPAQRAGAQASVRGSRPMSARRAWTASRATRSACRSRPTHCTRSRVPG
jgi:hypothetical protein